MPPTALDWEREEINSHTVVQNPVPAVMYATLQVVRQELPTNQFLISERRHEVS